MQWQDWAFSIGGFILFLSLVPTIRAKEKPALTTCIMTAILITIFAFTMASLSLWLSAFSNTLNASAWYLLAYQKYRQQK